MKQTYFFILFFIFVLSFSVIFSGCSSTLTVPSSNSSAANSGEPPKVSTAPSQASLVASDLEYLVTLNAESIITLDGKPATVKITGANSKDDSVVLSVKQGAGENIKKVVQNQVVSFGALRICISDVVVNEATGNAQALLIPTYSQKAVSWFSMMKISNVSLICDVFKQAVEKSSFKNGAVAFFLEQFNPISDSTDFVSLAYDDLLGKSLDSLSLQAWEFYVAENGREKFLSLLVASDEFKTHESSIK